MTAVICTCGAQLHRTWRGELDGWVWVDGDGRTHARKEGTPDWDDLNRLARSDSPDYTFWLGQLTAGLTTHRHHPAVEPASSVTPPECCDWPMWLTPTDWVCRQDRSHRHAA